MFGCCYTRSMYSLPRKYLKTLLAVCDDTDFPKVVIIGHLLFTVWTRLDPVSIEKIY